MTEPFVLRNDVPTLERLLAVFFIAVGAPLTYLGWRDADELPELLVPVVQIGLPFVLVLVVWRAFVHRRRLAVTMQPDGIASIEERVLFWSRRRTASVLGADLEMGEDIDGDPYGSLVLRLADGDTIVAGEGNDIEALEGQLREVRHRIGG